MRIEQRDGGRRTGLWIWGATAAVGLLLLAAAPARAINYTWTNNGQSANWSDPGNWGGTAPSNNEIGASLTFPELELFYDSNNDLTGLHVTFLSVTTKLDVGNYTFTGNAISLEGPATFSSPGTGNPNLVWQIPLDLGNNITFAASGRQTQLQGNINLGSRNLTFNTGGDIVVTGTISGTGNLVKNNTSALTLRGINTYSGTTTSNNGALYIDNAAALGSGDGGTTVNNGALSFAPGSDFLLGEPLVFSGGGILGYGTVTINGTVAVNAPIEVRAFEAASVVTIESAISGTGGLNIAGAGTVVLSGNNTYAGATSVSSGALQLDGFVASAQGVTVRSGATLRGIGSTAGPCNVESGGTLSPGASPGSFACGGLTMTSGATLAMEINGPLAATQYDQITVGGPVSLGGATLAVTLGFTPADGQSFTLLVLQQGGGAGGTFAGLPNGGTFEVSGTTFGITYGDSEVEIVASPGTNTPTPTEGGATPSPTPTSTPIVAACTGDCDGSGDVGINELIRGVNIALGNETVANCPPFDVNGDSMVAISELIAAVNNALGGCA